MSTKRIKDASFLQQHIEKLILAGGILVFLGAVFLFVVGNPFAIELNRQTYVDPSDAVDVLVRTDKALKNGLQDPKPLPLVNAPQFREDFLAMMDQRADLMRMVAGLGHPGLTWASMIPDIPEPPRYARVSPPVPKNISHKTGTDVLDKEFDARATQTYFTHWGKELDEPGDFTMFIASGEFDIWQWISRLKAAPTEGEAIRIPAGIWAQRFGIAGVVLLREEWDPEQGQWTNRQIVEPLPGQVRVMPDAKMPPETNQALAEVNKIREAQLELARPELPWLDGFVQAVPPGNETDGEGAEGFIQSLDDENLGPAEKEIKKLQEKIEQLEARRAKRKNQGGNAGSAPDGVDGPGARTPRRDKIGREIENLRKRIERLRPQAQRDAQNRERLTAERRKREEERRRREELRRTRGGALDGPAEDPLAAAGLQGMELKEGATLRVWAADPSMRPGKTYQYKLLVTVINPLYAVPRLAADQLEENKQRAALLPTQAEIDAMPWIGPIKVEPESRFFLTGGRVSGASIDIFRRHKGELMVQDFDGAPGDSIGTVVEIENELGEVERVDMGVGAVLIDVEKRRDVFTGRTVYAMTYTDGQGNIFERIDAVDKTSPVRKSLAEEIENGSEQILRPDTDAQPEDDFDPDRFGPGGSRGF